MTTNNSSNASNAQYNLLVGTGSSYTSLPPGATVGTPLCSGGVSSNPTYDTTPTVSSITITNAPSSGTDGANKDYVDLTTGGFNYKNTTYASTTANLNATYANGAAGVGATLTNAGTQAAFSTDGVSPPINSRILVQFQTAAADNGIYDLTTVGTGASNWVLTRSTDYDTAAEILQGTIVPVANGTLYHDTLWLQTDLVTTVGTDPINFNQFGGTAVTTVQYNSLVGGTSNSIVSVAPTATAGIPLVSTGNASNPSFTTAVVAGGGTGATSFSDVNSVLLTGATGTSALTSLTSGASGEVLTSQGVGVAPIWTTPAGYRILLQSQTASSSATLDFVTGFSSSYSSYIMEFQLVKPGTDNQILQLQFSIDGGVSWIATNSYLYVQQGLNSASTATTSLSGSGNPCNLISIGSSTTGGVQGEMQLWAVSQVSQSKGTMHTTFQDAGTNLVNCQGSVFLNSGAVINGIRIFFASGNIASGTIRLFGVT